MDDNTKKELQSATFERLVDHLRERKDVQNIDLMNLAGFCRNCLSKWYREEAEKKGLEIEKEAEEKEKLYAEFSEKSERIHTLNQLLKAYTYMVVFSLNSISLIHRY